MRKVIAAGIGAALVAAAALSGGAPFETPAAIASDHSEAPATQEDSSLDLTDLYVFGSADERTTLIACFDGLSLPNGEAPFAQGAYNQDAIYTFNVDNDGDNAPDIQIHWRFGEDQEGNVGVQWLGIPGAGGEIVGGVEEVLDAGGTARVWTGTADDPFFFDAGGYLATLGNGSLFVTAGDPASGLHWTKADFLAGFNVKAAAIEIDTALLQDADAPGPIQVWITSGTL